MAESLKQFLRTHVPLEPEELEAALPLFRRESLKKNGFFHKAGRIAERLAFVNEGILRSYYTFKKNETTTFFLSAGSIAVALPSFVRRIPAMENIQALTDTELMVIHRKDLYRLYNENWKWQQLGRVVTENAYIAMEERSISLQIQSAQERYEQFLADYPGLIRQISLHQIASFLGMSPETLSRIRKSMHNPLS